MLNEKQRVLWQKYLDLEKDRIRYLLLAGLEEFIRALEETPGQWSDWAKDIARRVVDQEESIPVRMPLFERVLFPALLEGFRAGEKGCARWLAGFNQLLYHCAKCQEALGDYPTEIALLRRALEDDPADRRARRKLIDALEWQLSYAVHEVPAGVLYGNQGASPEECEQLQLMLDDFCQLAQQEGVLDHYQDFVEECGLHFRAYREYQLSTHKWTSYEHFLSEMEPSWKGS